MKLRKLGSSMLAIFATPFASANSRERASSGKRGRLARIAPPTIISHALFIPTAAPRDHGGTGLLHFQRSDIFAGRGA